MHTAQWCAAGGTMRPIQEQAWCVKTELYGTGTRVRIVDERGRTVAHVPAFDPTATDEREVRAAALAAAPDMAQALSEAVTDHDPLCACTWCGALKKAGVL